MTKVNKIRTIHIKELEKHCQINGVSITSIQKLLEIEKSKKLQKRNALIQQHIDREIDNAIDHENK